jgi:hypothetical protein
MPWIIIEKQGGEHIFMPHSITIKFEAIEIVDLVEGKDFEIIQPKQLTYDRGNIPSSKDNK